MVLARGPLVPSSSEMVCPLAPGPAARAVPARALWSVPFTTCRLVPGQRVLPSRTSQHGASIRFRYQLRIGLISFPLQFVRRGENAADGPRPCAMLESGHRRGSSASEPGPWGIGRNRSQERTAAIRQRGSWTKRQQARAGAPAVLGARLLPAALLLAGCVATPQPGITNSGSPSESISGRTASAGAPTTSAPLETTQSRQQGPGLLDRPEQRQRVPLPRVPGRAGTRQPDHPRPAGDDVPEAAGSGLLHAHGRTRRSWRPPSPART